MTASAEKLRTILVQAASKGGYKYISVKIEGSDMHREFGLVNGRVQTKITPHKAINVGKANEKSPEEAAAEAYWRLLKKKMSEGYREVDLIKFSELCAGGFRDDHTDDLDSLTDFSNPPSSFVCSKPNSKIEDKKLDKLLSEPNRAIAQIKENGLCHWIFADFPEGQAEAGVKVFDRRMHDHTEKYPEVVKAVQALPISGETVFACELVITPTGKGHSHDFRLIQGISRADCNKDGVPEGDLAKTRERTEANPVRAMIFHVLWLDGEPLWQQPYNEAWKWLTTNLNRKEGGDLLYHPEVVGFDTADDMRAEALQRRKVNEGYVVWDMHAAVEVGFTGKPKRRAAYKVKPLQECDVLVTGWEEGKRGDGLVAKLHIGAYNEDGKIVSFGKCGSGITDESAQPSFWGDLPCVIQMEFEEQFETGKFKFPVFVGKHPDKTPEEVTCDDFSY